MCTTTVKNLFAQVFPLATEHSLIGSPLLYKTWLPPHIALSSLLISKCMHPKKTFQGLTLDSIIIRGILKTPHSCSI